MIGWTEARVEILKTMWIQGFSAFQIAEHLGGVTRNAVIGKVHRMGLQERSTTPALESRRRAARDTLEKARKRREGTLPPKPSIAAEPLPPERPVPPGAVTFDDLQPWHCRFPFGDDPRTMTYCGCKKLLGVSYCKEHAEVAFAIQPPREKKKTPDRLFRVKTNVEFEDA